MSRLDKKFGQIAEAKVALILVEHGFDIVDKNYHTRFGEIDIIANKDNVWHFIEVKARRSDKYGSGEEALTEKKRDKLIKSINTYLQKENVRNKKYQGDLIVMNLANEEWEYKHYENILEDVS